MIKKDSPMPKRNELQRKVERLMLQGVSDTAELSGLLNEASDEVEEMRRSVIDRWVGRVSDKRLLTAEVAARLEFMERRLWALFFDSTQPSEQMSILKSIMGVVERYINLLKLDKTDFQEEDDEELIEEIKTVIRDFVEEGAEPSGEA